MRKNPAKMGVHPAGIQQDAFHVGGLPTAAELALLCGFSRFWHEFPMGWKGGGTGRTGGVDGRLLLRYSLGGHYLSYFLTAVEGNCRQPPN